MRDPDVTGFEAETKPLVMLKKDRAYRSILLHCPSENRIGSSQAWMEYLNDGAEFNRLGTDL